MAEREGPDARPRPRAARLLALHADHRRHLHPEPVPDCIQCTFDGLVRVHDETSSDELPETESA